MKIEVPVKYYQNPTYKSLVKDKIFEMQMEGYLDQKVEVVAEGLNAGVKCWVITVSPEYQLDFFWFLRDMRDNIIGADYAQDVYFHTHGGVLYGSSLKLKTTAELLDTLIPETYFGKDLAGGYGYDDYDKNITQPLIEVERRTTVSTKVEEKDSDGNWGEVIEERSEVVTDSKRVVQEEEFSMDKVIKIAGSFKYKDVFRVSIEPEIIDDVATGNELYFIYPEKRIGMPHEKKNSYEFLTLKQALTLVMITNPPPTT